MLSLNIFHPEFFPFYSSKSPEHATALLLGSVLQLTFTKNKFCNPKTHDVFDSLPAVESLSHCRRMALEFAQMVSERD